MVNIRATLDAAERAGVLTVSLAGVLTNIAKKTFYKERNYERVLRCGAIAGVPEQVLRDLSDWLPTGRADRKRLDAEAMIDAIQAHLAAGLSPLRISYEFANTAAWQAARKRTQ
jgi:hypothetical protein